MGNPAINNLTRFAGSELVNALLTSFNSCVKVTKLETIFGHFAIFWTYKVHFRSILGSLQVHFMSIQVHFMSIQVHFMSIQGPFKVHLRSILGPFKVHIRPILVISGQFSVNSRANVLLTRFKSGVKVAKLKSKT